MVIKIYNTLTRKKETFKPTTPGLLKIYVCGLTVYDNPHIGHAFSNIFYDVLINYFKHFHNYNILYIRNITDVGHLTEETMEDKIEKRAIERKMHPMELVYMYTKKMWENYDALLLDRPNIEPTATGHLIEMQDWIKQMLEEGFAYKTKKGNIYFDISKVPEYGKLANKKIDELEKDTRFETDPEKKNPHDFALWKIADEKHIMKWSSPWGVGFPGWHLECSIMSTKYLDDKFDIHGGAVDLVFPHHENERAQNYAHFKKEVVKYWVHTALLTINGKKMSKSLGNFITIDEYLKKHSPQALRYLKTSGHYRKPQDYSEQAIIDAEKTLEKINNFIQRLEMVDNNSSTESSIKQILETTKTNFSNAMDDDFNTPAAWANIHLLIKETNKLLDKNALTTQDAQNILEFLKKINLVFKVFTFKKEETQNKPKIKKEEIEKLIEKRNKLREQKKWEEADAIRAKFREKGIILFDDKNKTTWTYA
jgi:cysteinyl-tRNA synthetase